jgi:hypothetical protein
VLNVAMCLTAAAAAAAAADAVNILEGKTNLK